MVQGTMEKKMNWRKTSFGYVSFWLEMCLKDESNDEDVVLLRYSKLSSTNGARLWVSEKNHKL